MVVGVGSFFKFFDLACINIYIIWKEVTKSKLSRRKFLLKLKSYLCTKKANLGNDVLQNCHQLDNNLMQKRLQRQGEAYLKKSFYQSVECMKVYCGEGQY